MATIAGGVLAAYIGYLGGDTPEGQLFFAKHLLTASVLSAPAAIISAKILLPETEDVIEVAEISSADMGSNALDAISNGTTERCEISCLMLEPCCSFLLQSYTEPITFLLKELALGQA